MTPRFPSTLGSFMYPRELGDLLLSLDAACRAEPARDACRSSAAEGARTLVLPWVHRTGASDPFHTWRSILLTGGLTPSNVKAHEAADGRRRTVYFFLATCAYPKGHIAFVFKPNASDLTARATFSPFDTGSLLGWAEPDRSHPAGATYWPWNDENRCRFLQEYTGAVDSLPAFAQAFLASHFRRAQDYVTRPQKSFPDFPAYHALRSLTGDRRAWTIEVQVHGEDIVPLDLEHLQRIFVDGMPIFQELPSELKTFAQVVHDDADQDSSGDPLAEACAHWICQQSHGAGA